MKHQTIKVKVERDHLETLSRSKKPLTAIAELIWNGLDADATLVEISFRKNKLGGITEIIIRDNGHGLPHEDGIPGFQSLGGSLKRDRKSPKGRILHGQHGKGRFRSFSLGDSVIWETYYKYNGKTFGYNIEGGVKNLGTFIVSEPEETNKEIGTTVRISDIQEDAESLAVASKSGELIEDFALYLMQYPMVKIVFDSLKLDPSEVIDRTHEKEFSVSLAEESNKYIGDAFLTIIEWKIETRRKMYICDENGFSLGEFPAGTQARGFNFTVYLKAPKIINEGNKEELELGELNPSIKALFDAAKKEIKDYFRARASEASSELVKEWKKEKIYPYEGEPEDLIERTERQIFDLCAVNFHDYLPNFESFETKNKKVTFGLLKNTIETNPSLLRRLITELLELPKEKQEELSTLLEKTTLEAIITASKTVADRLNFIRSLEILVFDPKSKQELLEREQLHRILANETWLFGEAYNLTNDDESLTEVLKKHLNRLGKDCEVYEPVLRTDGSKGVVDLVLGRTIPMPNPIQHENLVIELKRPKIKIDNQAIQQLQSYANAIAMDERFRNSDTKWTFVTLSNDISKDAEPLTRQRLRPIGLVHDYDISGFQISIWVKTWSQITDECKARLKFFKDRLDYNADRTSAIQYLRQTYSKYLPGCLGEDKS